MTQWEGRVREPRSCSVGFDVLAGSPSAKTLQRKEATMRKLTLLAFFVSVGVFTCPTIATGSTIGLQADPKTITINFDSTQDFTESDGVKGTATKSSLT